MNTKLKFALTNSQNAMATTAIVMVGEITAILMVTRVRDHLFTSEILYLL